MVGVGVVMLHTYEVVGIGNPWGVGVWKSKTHLGRNPKLGREGKENRDPDREERRLWKMEQSGGLII